MFLSRHIFLLYAIDQSNHGSHGRMKYENLDLNRIIEIKTGYNKKYYILVFRC